MNTLTNIDLGSEIKKRFDASGMTQSEFGAKIGVLRQNVSRIFSASGVDTKRLVAISEALNFNFFSLFCDASKTNIREAGRDFVEQGDIYHNGSEICSPLSSLVPSRSTAVPENCSEEAKHIIEKQEVKIELMQSIIDSKEDQISTLKDQISTLKETIQDLRQSHRID